MDPLEYSDRLQALQLVLIFEGSLRKRFVRPDPSDRPAPRPDIILIREHYRKHVRLPVL